MTFQKPEGVQARHGDKMIEVRLRFWTNEIAAGDNVLPLHAWDKGYAQISSNESHGITQPEQFKFNSFAEIPLAISQALEASKVLLYTSHDTRRLFRSSPEELSRLG